MKEHKEHMYRFHSFENQIIPPDRRLDSIMRAAKKGKRGFGV